MFHQVFVCDSAPEDLKPEEPMDTSQLEQEFQVPIVIKQEEILLSTEETPSEPSFDYGSNVNEDVVLAMETSQPKEERKLSLDTIYTEPAPSIEQHLGSDAKLQTSFVKLTDVKFDKLLSHVMEDKVLLKDLENKFFMDSVDDIKKEEKDPDLGDPNVTYNLVEKIKPEVKTVKTEIVIKEELDSDSMNVEEEDTEDNLANENTEEENLVKSSSETFKVDEEEGRESSETEDENTITCKEQEPDKEEDIPKQDLFPHNVSKTFKCSKCYYKSASEDKLRAHNENNHLESEELECDWCCMILTSKRLYDQHQAVHEQPYCEEFQTQVFQTSKRFNCRKCSFTNDAWSVFFEHRKNEHSKSSRCSTTKRLCEICGKVVIGSLERHNKVFCYKEKIKNEQTILCKKLIFTNDGNLDIQDKMEIENETRVASKKQIVVGNSNIDIRAKVIKNGEINASKEQIVTEDRVIQDKGEIENRKTIPSNEEICTEDSNIDIQDKVTIKKGQTISCKEQVTTEHGDVEISDQKSTEHEKVIACKDKSADENIIKLNCENAAQKDDLKNNLCFNSVSKPFKCSKCYYKSATEENLRIHHEKNHLQLEEHKCEICSVTLNSKFSYALHLAIHDNPIAPVPIKKTENKEIKPNRRNKQCEVCGKMMFQKVYNRHMSVHKKKVKSIKCTECPYAATQKNIVDKHYKSVHLKLRPYDGRCSKCGYKTKCREDMRRHKATHKLPSPAEVPTLLKCPVCDKDIISKRRLRLHMDKHKTRKCSLCSETFRKTSRSTYARHLREAHGLFKEFTCNVCGKVCYSTAAIYAHKLTHSRPRTYFCNECGRAFKTKAHMAQHSITHLDARPFSCPQCGEKFKRQYSIKAHIAVVHKKPL